MSGLSWVPLESNPEVINKYLLKLGIDSHIHCVDLLGFDEDSTSLVPGEPIAVLFLFPVTDKTYQLNNILKSEEAPQVYFIKQTVGNACGTMALIHALANNHENIDFGAGCFAKFYEKSKDCSSIERANILEADPDMRAAHEICAESGDTQPPPADSHIDFHFVAMVDVKDHLYILDGSKDGPIAQGETSRKDFFRQAVGICEKFTKTDPENINFTALVLTKLHE